MKKTLVILGCLFCIAFNSCGQEKKAKSSTVKNEKNMEYNKLTPEEERVIVNKGTEYPGTGKSVK